MYRSKYFKTKLSTRNLFIMTIAMLLWLLLYAQFTAVISADTGGMVSADSSSLIINTAVE